jgi:hypothetical protein
VVVGPCDPPPPAVPPPGCEAGADGWDGADGWEPLGFLSPARSDIGLTISANIAQIVKYLDQPT